MNLEEHRKFVQKDDPGASFVERLPESLQKSMAETRLRMLRTAEEYEHLQRLASSFKPSTIPALDNPALVPLLNLRFNNAKLRDLFYPLRSSLYSAEYEALYRRFGLYFHTSSMSDPSGHFQLWVLVGQHHLRTDKIRAAYDKVGVNWVEAVVSAAAELKFEERKDEGRALLLIPRECMV
ncbi:hypothetical protein E1N52_27090 [Paraburkholderia guartelaensis]|uniref:Uncharacterized protein n=1 Tax=Paraburkholderia guartelaensis TaxID=2546446 RepID=A0A4R5LA53_9BURK|nr:hypothetical protein [Paraburkholderia guartelaensis]TDG05103.1 hypothetical protein E1N52_27090 [Paraburkholderia guartelaensis]